MGDWASEVAREQLVELTAAGGTEPVPESLHEQGGEAGARTTTEGVEEEEALETSTVVSQLPDPVRYEVHDHLAHGVEPTGIVVDSVWILFPAAVGRLGGYYIYIQLDMGEQLSVMYGGQHSDLNIHCLSGYSIQGLELNSHVCKLV